MPERFTQFKDCLVLTIDKGLSRKFIVWVVSTVALFTNYLPSESWVMISLLYVGAQAVLDHQNNASVEQPTIKTE